MDIYGGPGFSVLFFIVRQIMFDSNLKNRIYVLYAPPMLYIRALSSFWNYDLFYIPIKCKEWKPFVLLWTFTKWLKSFYFSYLSHEKDFRTLLNFFGGYLHFGPLKRVSHPSCLCLAFLKNESLSTKRKNLKLISQISIY